MILVLASLLALASGAPSVRVIDGDDVLITRYPYLVSIQTGLFGDEHFCSGAIISPNWVLTAAHCVGVSLIISRVVAGTADLKNLTNSQIRNIDLYNAIKHPDYDGIKNDIALLKMTEPFVFNELVQPLQISKVACYALDEINVFTGWGKESEASTLQTANMTIVPFDTCCDIMRSVYADNVNIWEDMHICVKGDASPCLLDGGGPLIQDNRLIGVLSWLPGTCLDDNKDNVPAIFTNTGHFKDFIKQYVTDLIVY